MKLLRYGPPGQEKPGLLDRDGKIRDLSGTVRDIDGEALSPASLDRLRRLDSASLPLVSGSPRLGPCVGHISKVLAIGLNYRLHAQEAGMAIPKEPIFFPSRSHTSTVPRFSARIGFSIWARSPTATMVGVSVAISRRPTCCACLGVTAASFSR